MTPDSTPPPADLLQQGASGGSSAIAAVAVAALGGALLLDAAVETVWSGSPVRRWAVGAAVLYFATTVTTWRMRIGWRGRLGIFGLVVFGLLAATAWRPEGLIDGVRLLGQSTGIVLSSATVVALVVAVLVLLRATAMLLAARTMAALLAIYGIAAFAFAASQATTYPALFKGASLWQAAPHWLQGSVVGGLVALPIALLVSLAGGLRRGERAWRAQQIALLGLAFATALGGFANRFGPNHEGDGPAPAVARAAADSVVAKNLSPTESTGDIAAGVRIQAARLGNDSGSLLAWVASNIANDVYAGAFRGPSRTLAARSGNGADKALLLRDLIQASDPAADVRFAFCTLPDNQAAQIVESARLHRAARRKLVFEVAGRLAERSRDTTVRALLERSAKVWQAVTDEADAESRQLASALDQTNVRLGESSPLIAELRSLAAQHVWVQRREANAWIDLDPTLEAAVPRQTRCPISSIAPALPADWYDTLTVKVRIEERKQEALQSRYLLEESWRIVDLADATVTFMFAEPIGLKGVVSAASVAPTGTVQYTPVLQVGDRYTIGQALFLPAPPSSSRGGLGTSVAKPLDGLTSLFGGPKSEPTTSSPNVDASAVGESDITASWLELKVATPGGWNEAVGSPIFDRIGYAARDAGNAPKTKPTLLPDADGEYLPLLNIWSVVASTGASPEAAGGLADTADDDDAGSVVRALGRAHRGYGAVRQALFASTDTSGASSTFMTRPTVTLLAFGPASDLHGNQLLMDVMSDHARTLVEAGSPARTPAISWAVASLLAERLLVNGKAMIAGVEPAAPQGDVIAILAAARQAHVPLEVLRPSDAAKVQSIDASVEARARLVARLAEGRTVLLPGRASGSFGWWVLNPEDGSIRDEMENGRHGQPVAEHPPSNEPPKRSAPWWRRQGQKIGCVIGLVGVLMGESPEDKVDAIEAVYEYLEKISEEDKKCK